MSDLKLLLTDGAGKPISPELERSLLLHLSPLERRIVEHIDARPDAFAVTAAKLRISEECCREVYEEAITWLFELANDALACNDVDLGIVK